MRVLNDDNYKAILKAARKEFVDKGFKGASMRTIAKESNVGLSNIYNYFKNKDEIFMAIVSPAKEQLFNFITEQHKEVCDSYELPSPLGHNEEAVNTYINFILKHKEELRLLLFQSQGSSLENFRDMFTDHMTETSFHYMELEKEQFPFVKDVSPFFIHAVASWMTSILGEIVTHNIDKEELLNFFYAYFRYGFAGWREVRGLDKKM